MTLICPIKSVYFIHDHAVHDTTGFKRYVSSILIYVLSRASSLRVVHDPSFCDRYQATYLPHPLYWDFPFSETPDSLSSNINHRNSPDSSILFGTIGAIRPYKQIDKLLTVWPRQTKLIIKGRAQADYVAQLEEIIQSHNLKECVSLQPFSMSQDELEEAFDSIDVLLLPHEMSSALVSGSFFEGIGRVPVIIARASPFILWAAQTIPGILPFTNDSEIPALVEKAKNLVGQRGTAKILQISIEAFGQKRCIDDYQHALQKKKGRKI